MTFKISLSLIKRLPSIVVTPNKPSRFKILSPLISTSPSITVQPGLLVGKLSTSDWFENVTPLQFWAFENPITNKTIDLKIQPPLRFHKFLEREQKRF